jgi:hypothetical protein
MTPKLVTHLLALSLLATSGCTHPTRQGRAAEAYVPDSGSVAFDIKPFKGHNASIRLEATHESRGKHAKFTIEFGPAHNIDSKDPKDFPIGTARVDFLLNLGQMQLLSWPISKKAFEANPINLQTNIDLQPPQRGGPCSQGTPPGGREREGAPKCKVRFLGGCPRSGRNQDPSQAR